jgi:Holliday junction resolvase RusA-like endonuclease
VTYSIELPLPPTLSDTTTNVRGIGRPHTEEAKAFRKTATLIVRLLMRNNGWKRLERPAAIRITLYPTSLRPDAANFEKTITDSLVEAGLLHNDSLRWVQENTQRLGAVDPLNPRCVVELWEIWEPSTPSTIEDDLDEFLAKKKTTPPPAPTPQPVKFADRKTLTGLARPATYPKGKL